MLVGPAKTLKFLQDTSGTGQNPKVFTVNEQVTQPSTLNINRLAVALGSHPKITSGAGPNPKVLTGNEHVTQPSTLNIAHVAVAL